MSQIDVVKLGNLLSWYNCCVATNDPDRPDLSKCNTVKQLTDTLQKGYENWRKKNDK